jgi:hypothetical protein
VTLYTDIPTAGDLELLMSVRRPGCVAIYLPTSPITAEAVDADRIELKNLARDAIEQLESAGMDKREVAAVSDALAELDADEVFWSRQAHSVAVFANPDWIRRFRLPNRLEAMVEVSDRFHVKPLLRTVTFPQAAYVLALSANGARLVEVAPDAPAGDVRVPELPSDAASAVGKSSLGDRSPDRRIQGSEGQKVRLRQYARQVDEALRPLLRGSELPLILAATEPLESIYRSVNSYPRLAEATLEGNPDELSDAQLAEASRAVLDGLYSAELAGLRDQYETLASQGRTSDDVATVARAATFGAVATLFADIDESVPGTIDEQSGEVTLDDADDAINYGVVDEIARRTLLSRGRVLAIRRDDMPSRGPVAAILRYPV